MCNAFQVYPNKGQLDFSDIETDSVLMFKRHEARHSIIAWKAKCWCMKSIINKLCVMLSRCTPTKVSSTSPTSRPTPFSPASPQTLPTLRGATDYGGWQACQGANSRDELICYLILNVVVFLFIINLWEIIKRLRFNLNF